MARDATEALIRRYYAAFNAQNAAGMLSCLSDDVIHDVNQGERRTGKSLFADFMAHMNQCYREELRDISIMSSADGMRGAAEFVVHGKYLATDEGLPVARGQTYVLPGGTFFALRGGLISRVTTSYNLKDWMAQVAG